MEKEITFDMAEQSVRFVQGRTSCGKHCKQDASRWITHLTWHAATKQAPVYGYLVLIADHNGFVNVLDLRRPEGEAPGSDDDFKRTMEALKRNNAKWWAYIPLSPPVNVDAVSWEFDSDGNPSLTEANDPPKDEWIWARNLPHEIVK